MVIPLIVLIILIILWINVIVLVSSNGIIISMLLFIGINILISWHLKDTKLRKEKHEEQLEKEAKKEFGDLD
jgi:c-di-AMP phosphodiesterase-like protein